MSLARRWLNKLGRWGRRAPKAPPPVPVRNAVTAALGPGALLALNVGARWGDDGAWWRIAPLVTIVGFEPDQVECDRLNALCADSARERYLPLALGAAVQDAELHVTFDPACSSLYAPIEALAERYPALQQIRLIEKQVIRLTPLDHWWESERRPIVDFVKLDTQGSELDILRGAQAMLVDCAGCEIEVEFSPIYHGQPLFTDVDTFMRAQGFVLWRLHELTHYPECWPRPREQGRLMWSSAVYLRDYRSLGTTDKEQRQRLVLAALLEALDDHEAAKNCLASASQTPAATTDVDAPPGEHAPSRT